MTETLTIDDLEFELRRSPKRRTVGITVDRAGELILHAPVDLPVEAIERIATDKQLWIHSKLATKERLSAEVSEKEYVSGEGFYYLGRSHRLKLVDDAGPTPLRLYRGRFELRRDRAEQGRDLYIRWYRSHAGPWIQRRLELWTPRVGAEPSEIVIRSLGNRWGSCTLDGKLLFHWRTILLPPSIIDYLLVHELVHLQEPLHSPEFWQRLERTMPDYHQRKHWLAQHGAEYSI